MSQELRSLLMDIKGEINDVNEQMSEVKKTQEKVTEGFSNVDTKMNEVKASIGAELGNVKINVVKNEALLTKVQNSQSQLEGKLDSVNNLKDEVVKNSNLLSNMKEAQKSYDSQMDTVNQKMVSLNDKTCDLEIDMLKQRRCNDQANQNMTTQISDIEYGLAAHIEVIKGNMEKEIAGSKQNQIRLEDKFQSFTSELSTQNENLNSKIQTLRKDFEQLKTLSDNCSPLSRPNSASNSYTSNSPQRDNYSPLPRPNSASNLYTSFSSQSEHSSISQNDSSIFSVSSTTTRAENSCSNCHFHDNLPNDNTGHGENLYMYGDTTRTLIFDGLKELVDENLIETVVNCINDISVPLIPTDIINVCRIGKHDQTRTRPRPVKVTLKEQTKRDQVFIFKSRLRYSENFANVRVNKEERRDIRIKAAKLRQAGLTARKLGRRVEFAPDYVRIDGIAYDIFSLDSIPEIFTKRPNKVQPPPPENVRRLTLLEKSRTDSDKVIMVGPSLQKTSLGLAFYSSNCFLSNFYPCKFYFKGQPYTSLEQGYQGTKAKIYRDEVAFEAILKAKTPSQMKRIGSQIKVDGRWEGVKSQVMEDLLFAKFRQNKSLYYSLLNTRPLNLIEATIDDFWGAGCMFGSIALEEGCWIGKNTLGKLLVRVRTILVRELTLAQGSIG